MVIGGGTWSHNACAHHSEPSLLRAAEIPVPDLRLELTPSRMDLCLSWLVHLWLGSTGGKESPSPLRPWFTAFGEPQWVPRRNAGRIVGGVRTHLPIKNGLSAIVDTAGIAGTDGSGAITGGGFGFAFYEGRDIAASFLAIMYRCVWLFQRPRHDLSLDLLMVAFSGFVEVLADGALIALPRMVLASCPSQ